MERLKQDHCMIKAVYTRSFILSEMFKRLKTEFSFKTNCTLTLLSHDEPQLGVTKGSSELKGCFYKAQEQL